LSYIYEATKYFNYLKEHYFKDHESRWQNLSELLSVAKRTKNSDAQTSNSFYNEYGFEGKEEEEDVDEYMSDGLFSDFSDIDIDRPLKKESEKSGKPTTRSKKNVKTEDSVKKKEKPEFSVKSEVKPEKPVKSENPVKLDDVEENYRMMQVNI
jgi:hypothetical protein